MTAITATDAPAAAPDAGRRPRRRARELSGLAGWTVLGWETRANIRSAKLATMIVRTTVTTPAAADPPMSKA